MTRVSTTPPPGRLEPLFRALRWLWLLLGPALAVLVYQQLPEARFDALGEPVSGLSEAGRATAAVVVLMAIWWLTEAIPLAATALLPVVLFPLLGATTVGEAAAPYARDLIFLFLGGFLIGLAMQRWGLHRRLALHTLRHIGTRPRRLVAGFMVISAGLSMWVSNTATAIMLLPIGLSIVHALAEHGGQDHPRDFRNFATALMLGIAYAASIGGVATLIGSPPNMVMASFAGEMYGIEVTMRDWLTIGLPLALVFLPIAWLYLTWLAFPVRLRKIEGSEVYLDGEIARLGPMRAGEWVVLVVFVTTAAAWVLRPQLVAWTGLTGLSDPVIAMIGGLSLFLIPVGLRSQTFAMDWETAKGLPWHILLLFGGGLSIANALVINRVDLFLASGLTALAGMPEWVIVLGVASLVVFLTELTSNTAVATTLMPVVAAMAAAFDAPPLVLLVITALAASFAFMLPVATPPNAIVFSSGYVSVGQMARAGLGLNLIAIALLTGLALLLPGLLGLT